MLKMETWSFSGKLTEGHHPLNQPSQVTEIYAKEHVSDGTTTKFNREVNCCVTVVLEVIVRHDSDVTVY